MKAVLIRADKEIGKLITEELIIKNDLEDFYKHLNCDCIDIKNLDTGYCAIFDDEGMLKEGNVAVSLSNILFGQELRLAGNILIVANDEEKSGELRGLTPLEVANVVEDTEIRVLGLVSY